MLIKKLKKHQEDKNKNAELRNDKALQNDQALTANINVTANTYANAQATVNASFETAIQILNSIPASELNQQDKTDIEKQLSELDDAAKSKNKKRIKQLAKVCFDTIVDKCLKYAPQLASYILRVIQDIFQ